MASEQKMLNCVLIAHLHGSVIDKQRALDAITDFVCIKAREEHYQLPVRCARLRQGNKLLA